MEINFISIIVAAISTLFIGFIWYNPKFLGTIWMRESGTSEEKMKQSNMLVIFLLAVFYAFLISFILQFSVIHQFSAFAATVNINNVDPSILNNYMDAYGNTYRTFKHGALHGFMTGLFLAFPMIATQALFERKSFKYSLINGGFWIVNLTLMGGIICAWK